MKPRSRRQVALQNHLRRIDSRIADLKNRSESLSTTRLVLFIAGIAGSALLFYTAGEFYSTLGFIIFVVAFVILAMQHRKIDGSLKRHKIWFEIKSVQLARMRLDWGKIPLPSDIEKKPAHPFHADLDITGPQSLHHLLDTAISTDGSARLAAWLLNSKPQLEPILQRQKIIVELAGKSRFRDKLLLAFRLVSGEVLDSGRLLRWLKIRQRPGSLRWQLPLMTVMAGLNISLFLLQFLTGYTTYWLASLVLYGLVYFFNQNSIKSLLLDAVFLEDEITVLRNVLFYLERYPYGKAVNLREVCRPFIEESSKPSAQLRFIKSVATAVGLRMNPILGFILNVIVPWDFYCAWFLENGKDKLRETVPVWMESLIELESLNSLANFAWLNPGNTVPVFVTQENTADPVFATKQVRHPLLPADQAVCNDFALPETGRLVIITGSNMSGKSTFLRTIGANLCLAFAGSTVCAGSFSTALFRIFSCLRVNDSIIEGFSFFYAEVSRLKNLLDAARDRENLPVFFLIDEIFRGTNNRERLVGSRSFIRALSGSRSLGCVSTHDLELVHLADEIENISNSHFRETIENKQMVFDYLLKDGPCPTTNALEIMRLAGLPVDE